MPSFVVHALVPPLVFLALRFDWRKVLWLWPLTLVMDFDHFTNFLVPRATFHNVFILLPPALMLWFTYRYPAYESRREWALLALGYLGSHLLMDFFNGGWTPLFPFSDVTALVWFYIMVRQPEHTFYVVWEPETSSGPPVLSAEYPWLSPFETAMLMFVVTAFAIAGVARWVRRRRERGNA